MKNKIKIDKTALLVIDVINNCCHSKNEFKKWEISFNKIRKMIPRLRKFISEYQELGGHVVFITCVPWSKKYLAKNIIELYKDPRCCYYIKDKSGFGEKFYGVEPLAKDFVVTKDSYDAFTNPKLDRYLKKHKIKYLIIAGVFGDGCVHATMQGGFSKGYSFIVLKDLIETTDVKTRQKLQKLLKEYTWPTMFGKTIESKRLFSYIRK